jgi:hypothetical protein
MEEIAEDTRNTVKESKELIKDTRDGQQVGAALEIMSDPHKAPTLRMASAETAILKGQEERVPLYIGLPGPSYKLMMIERPMANLTIEIPNVTLIGDKVDPDLTLAPLSEDLFQIEVAAMINFFTKVLFTLNTPGVDIAKIETMREATRRLIYVAPAIVGGMEMTKLKESIRINDLNRETPMERPYRLDVGKRLHLARLLEDAVRVLSLTEDEVRVTTNNIAGKLMNQAPIVVRR